jgi:hemophore-related protein
MRSKTMNRQSHKQGANMLPSAIKGVIGAGAVAGAALFGAAIASSDPPPSVPPPCTAAELARVMSGVTFDTSNYLTDHPDVNDFFTSLKGQTRDQINQNVQNYLDANPNVRSDLQGIRQPSIDFRARCGAPAQP